MGKLYCIIFIKSLLSLCIEGCVLSFCFCIIIYCICNLFSFAGILVVISPGSTIQIVSGMVLALCFIKLYSTYAPYVDDIISSVKSLTQWQIFAVYLKIWLG